MLLISLLLISIVCLALISIKLYVKSKKLFAQNEQLKAQWQRYESLDQREYTYFKDKTGYDSLSDLLNAWQSLLYNIEYAFGHILDSGFVGSEKNPDVYHAIEHTLRAMAYKDSRYCGAIVKDEEPFIGLYRQYPTIMPLIEGLNAHALTRIACYILFGERTLKKTLYDLSYNLSAFQKTYKIMNAQGYEESRANICEPCRFAQGDKIIYPVSLIELGDCHYCQNNSPVVNPKIIKTIDLFTLSYEEFRNNEGIPIYDSAKYLSYLQKWRDACVKSYS